MYKSKHNDIIKDGVAIPWGIPEGVKVKKCPKKKVEKMADLSTRVKKKSWKRLGEKEVPQKSGP